MPADQAQAQMHPGIAHFQAFFAAASMRLDVANLIRMRACFHGSSPPAHLRTVRGPAPSGFAYGAKKRRERRSRTRMKKVAKGGVAPSGRLTNALALA